LPEGLKYIELKDTDVALEKADILVLLVDHSQFKGLNLDFRGRKRLIDTKGVWEKA
jgi:UDP-N-acetyl-D-mannosaminuronic acid dehydrogenase